MSNANEPMSPVLAQSAGSEEIFGQEVGSKENAQTLRNLITKMAIGHADALLAELERTK